MTMEPINVARDVVRGMEYLHCTKREMLHMTPREFYTLWVEHLELHGIKVQARVSDIDSLP